MSYKVNYYTLVKTEDGRTGNIKQESGHFFTDNKIEEIPKILNDYLEAKKRVGVVTKIEDVKGACINN